MQEVDGTISYWLNHLCIFSIYLEVICTHFLPPDINIDCLKDSVNITWTIPAEFIPHATRFFLGNCIPSDFAILQTGEAELYFKYQYIDCNPRRRVMLGVLVDMYSYCKQMVSFTFPFPLTAERKACHLPE